MTLICQQNVRYRVYLKCYYALGTYGLSCVKQCLNGLYICLKCVINRRKQKKTNIDIVLFKDLNE